MTYEIMSVILSEFHEKLNPFGFVLVFFLKGFSVAQIEIASTNYQNKKP